MPSAERVSIVVTVRNEYDGIGPLMESLLAQIRRPDEIVIVDGGSTDGTIEALRSYEARNSGVRVFVEPGVNISQGRNYAIEKATSPLIAVTDGGCRQDPHWLEELIKPLLLDPEVMAVGGFTAINAHSPLERVSGLLVLPRQPAPSATVSLTGRCSAFRKEAWRRAGGYPDWLYTGEDTLYAMKIRALGFKVACAARAVVFWRPRSSLRKLFKMFYLYGKGNGRIGCSLGGSLYHLRNYALELLLIFLSALWPLFLMPLALMGAYFFATFYVPAISPIRASLTIGEALFLAPAVIWTKTVGYTAGILIGAYEYRFVPPFRRKLQAYLAGPGKATWTRRKAG